jgi:hypothetical protein
MLSFISKSINEVIIRGEPNAIIKCLRKFDFHHTLNITIKDMQIWNCLCTFYGIYTGDVTTNGTHHVVGMGPVVVEIKIMNSKFIDSGLNIIYIFNVMAQSMDATITIKNTTTTNCCSHLLPFVNIDTRNNGDFFPNVTLHITMENFNFLDNFLPLIRFVDKFNFCIIITFTGRNKFARNEASLVEISVTHDYGHNSKTECKHTLLFTSTEVYIIKSRLIHLTDGYEAPISVTNGNIIFFV